MPFRHSVLAFGRFDIRVGHEYNALSSGAIAPANRHPNSKNTTGASPYDALRCLWRIVFNIIK